MVGKTCTVIDIISLGTCDGTDIKFTDGAADGKFEFLLQDDSLEYLDGLEVGGTSVDGLNLGPNSGIVLDKSLAALDGLILIKYDGIYLESSGCYTG